VSDQPRESNREGHDREALRHHGCTQHSQSCAWPVRDQQQQRSEREDNGREVEVGAQHRAREQRRSGRGQHRPARIAPRAARQATHQRHQDRGQSQREHREGQSVGVVAGAQERGRRQERRGQRRVLEGHVAVWQQPVQEEVGVGAVQEEVGNALVTPRARKERDRKCPNQDEERRRPHRGTASSSDEGTNAGADRGAAGRL